MRISEKIEVTYYPKRLVFIVPATTSRGAYKDKTIYIIAIRSLERPGKMAYGECSMLPDLSPEWGPKYSAVLEQACMILQEQGTIPQDLLRQYPSILMGMESALRMWQGEPYSKVLNSEFGLPINGLVWMADIKTMMAQVETKIPQGYKVIKIKIGALDFEEELKFLKQFRAQYGPDKIGLRLDANGAFSPATALDQLQRLAPLGVHSIEQPIRAGQWLEMKRLCQESPIPIGLDEELIGVFSLEEKKRLLNTIKPQYLVLKPSLHGGFSGCDEWIALGEERQIAWWITSALESNLGLTALAYYTAQKLDERDLKTEDILPQGLGTGELFVENFQMPLRREGSKLIEDTLSFEKVVQAKKDHEAFWTLWYSTSDVVVHTSGSTGPPKALVLAREKLKISARRTLDFLGIADHSVFLNCMPIKYVAGMQMTVRALVSASSLVVGEVSSRPLRLWRYYVLAGPTIDLVALTPMMLLNTLEDSSARVFLDQVRCILVGGGPISKTLIDRVQGLSSRVYATYGMTESYSNIALRALNGEQASSYYKTLEGVSVMLNEEGCLGFKDTALELQLWTHDRAQILDAHTFAILGRSDSVINSGGVKIQTEEVEERLQDHIVVPFALVGVPHELLGEQLVLVSEHPVDPALWAFLPKHQHPQKMVVVPTLPRSENGKIRRQELKAMVLDLLKL